MAIFTTLILAGSYLFKLTDYMANGISFGIVSQLSVLLTPGVMVKTFPMAMLLACLLAFGRLSSDSEIVAVRAAGTSLTRVMMPVGAFGLAVAFGALLINEAVVPWAAYRATELTEGIEKQLKGGGESIFRPIHNPRDGKLIALLMAKDFNLGERSLRDAWVVGYDTQEKPIGMLYAKGLRYNSDNDWEIEGGGKLFSFDLTYVTSLDRIWPKSIAQPPAIEDIAAARLKDLDSFSMAQMRERIKIAKANPSFSAEQLRNLEYGLHNKIALPLAALIFGLLGAPLGIRNHRTGVAAGFSLSVLIIFGYMMLTRVMSLWALGGVIPPWSASYVPLVIGLLAAAEAIRRKNV